MHCKSTQLQAHVIVNETIRGTTIEAGLCDEKGEHGEIGGNRKRGDIMNTDVSAVY